MSDEKKAQEGRDTQERSKTNAYRAGFMTGYTNDNPSADSSVNGFYAGYVGTRPEKQTEQTAPQQQGS